MFYTPKPRRFQMVPRYWDPEKEAMEERKERIRKEKELADKSEYVSDIRHSLQEEYEKRKAFRRMGNSRRVMRLFLILIIILLGCFWFVSTKMDALVAFFE